MPPQRTPAKGAAAAQRTAAAAAASAAAPKSNSKPKAKAKAARAPTPEPEQEEEEEEAEEAEDDEQFSEPEEVDNDALMAEYEAQHEGEEGEEGESGDDDAEDEDEEDDEEEAEGEQSASSGASGSKKRGHESGSGAAGGAAKKAKGAAAAPSSDEVAQLRQTEELFKSNLFKLQLEELLREMHVDYDKLAKIDPLLHGLKADLEALPADEVRTREGTTLRRIAGGMGRTRSCVNGKRRVWGTRLLTVLRSVPLAACCPRSLAQLSYNPLSPVFGAPLPAPVLSSVASGASTASGAHPSFPFHPPTTFNLVGSYPLRTLLKEGAGAASLNVDVCVEMPAACLKEKDYWDYRYLAKRARYLEHLAAHLMAQGRFHVKLGKMRGAAEKPVLLLYPLKEVAQAAPAPVSGGKKKGASAAAAAASAPQFQPFTGILSKVVVRLFVNLPAGLFSAKRFHPSKSNLHARDGAATAAAAVSAAKVKTEGKGAAPKAGDDKNEQTGAATPYYNHLLLDDMSYTAHLAHLYGVFASCPALKESVMLLKLWVKQRKLDLARGARGAAGSGANGGWGEFELRAVSAAPAAAAAASSSNKKTPKKEKAAAVVAAPAGPPRVELVSPSTYLLSSPCGGSTGLNGFFLSMFLAHLVATKQIYRSMSTYQIFKIALQALVKIDMLAPPTGVAPTGPGAAGEAAGIVLGFDPSKSLHSLALLTNPLAAASIPREAEFLAHWSAARGFDVLFLDADGTSNFAARLTKQTYLELKQEAFLSLSYLDDSATLMQNIFGNGMLVENAAAAAAAGGSAASAPSASMVALQTLVQTSRPVPSSSSLGLDSFQTLFMTPSQFHSKFDAFVRVNLGADPETWTKASAAFHRKQGRSFLSLRTGLAHDADALTNLVRQVSALVEMALGDRILLVHVQPQQLQRDQGADLVLEIGLLLNPFHANRILDMGPSADDTVPAQHFRDLWGELSTLRRFKDGSIVEAVVWTTPGGAAGGAAHSAPHLIPFQIINYVLGRHLGVEAAHISSIVSQLDSLLKLRAIESQPTAAQLLRREGAGEPKPLLLSAPTIDPLFLHASSLFNSFKSLSTALKSLHQHIPLSIVNIRMTGEFARYTAPFAAPIPVDLTQLAPSHPAHSLLDVVPVLLQFESSSKWPDDSLAISRIKSAFYIQIGHALNDRHDVHSLVSLDALHIFYQGFVFKLQIFYEAELKIRQLEEKMGLVALGGPMIPVPTSAEINANFMFGPLLSQQLKYVQERYPLFAPTVRLVKRWISSHMFSPFFPRPEAIELMVTTLFTNPKPYAVPGTALQGLHRFLSWLCAHDFAGAPVVVDLTGEMQAETIEMIQARFAVNRANGTASLIYIATDIDRESTMLFPRVTPAPNAASNANLAAAAAAAAAAGGAAPLGEESCMDQFVLDRLVSYARSSLAHLEGLLESSSGAAGASAAHWKTLFKTPVSVPGAFDALLHLRPEALPVHYLAKAVAPPARLLASHAHKNDAQQPKQKKGYKLPPDSAVSAPAVALSSSGSSASRSVPLVGLSPIECLVASLRNLYGELAYFFYDSQGGTSVGVVWRDEFRRRLKAEGTLRWSVKHSAHARPVHDAKGRVEGLRLHLAEIIDDMQHVGEGLVERVEAAQQDADEQ